MEGCLILQSLLYGFSWVQESRWPAERQHHSGRQPVYLPAETTYQAVLCLQRRWRGFNSVFNIATPKLLDPFILGTIRWVVWSVVDLETHVYGARGPSTLQ